MSLIKANALQIGQSAVATQNFGLEVPAVPDGSMRLRRGNVGAAIEDLLTVAASGILSAGYNPSTGDRSTALATMQKFTDEFPRGTTWQKLPSGLIVQWGGASSPGNLSVSLPIAFPSACVAVVASPSANTNTTYGINITSYGTSNFTVSTNNANSPLALAFLWMAIGY